MPGTVSDAYDPEFGTEANCNEIRDALQEVDREIRRVIGDLPNVEILDLIHADFPRKAAVSLTEKEWRLIRFALDRAEDCL